MKITFACGSEGPLDQEIVVPTRHQQLGLLLMLIALTIYVLWRT